MFVCFFIMYFLLFSIPKVVFGSLADDVFEEYDDLFKRPEITKVLPGTLHTFREVGMNLSFRNSFLANPRFLFGINKDIQSLDIPADEFTDEFISLLTVDDALRSLFWDEQFYTVLTKPDEINKLIDLIESIPPATLVIKDGNNLLQVNPDDTPTLTIIVQNAKENPLEKIPVIFTVKGNGSLSSEEENTDEKGEAKTILTIGPNVKGIILVEARVKDTNHLDLMQTFTVVAIQAIQVGNTRPDGKTMPIVYITPPTNNIFHKNENFTLNLNFVNMEGVTSFEATVQFDPDAFEYVRLKPDANLKANAEVIDGEKLIITGNINEKTNVLAEVTFKVKATKTTKLTLSEVILNGGDGPEPYVLERYIIFNLTKVPIELIDIKPENTIPEDVNIDGLVNLLDLVVISNIFSSEVEDGNRADVNGDNKINIRDLTQVSSRMGYNARECPVLLCTY